MDGVVEVAGIEGIDGDDQAITPVLARPGGGKIDLPGKGARFLENGFGKIRREIEAVHEGEHVVARRAGMAEHARDAGEGRAVAGVPADDANKNKLAGLGFGSGRGFGDIEEGRELFILDFDEGAFALAAVDTGGRAPSFLDDADDAAFIILSLPAATAGDFAEFHWRAGFPFQPDFDHVAGQRGAGRGFGDFDVAGSIRTGPQHMAAGDNSDRMVAAPVRFEYPPRHIRFRPGRSVASALAGLQLSFLEQGGDRLAKPRALVRLGPEGAGQFGFVQGSAIRLLEPVEQTGAPGGRVVHGGGGNRPIYP